MPKDSQPAARAASGLSRALSPQDLIDFVESATVGMHTVAADGTILWANRAEYGALGLTAEEFVGRNVAAFHAEPAAIENMLERLRRGEDLHELPARMVRKNGSIRHVLLSSTSQRKHGALVHASFITLDAAPRRVAAESQARLAAIVTDSDDAIISKGLDGVIRTWNAGAERLFGYTAAEAIGQRIELIVPPELRAEEHDILERLRHGERIDHFETSRVTKSGRRLNISLTISPIYDSGDIVGASTVARDVTAHKAAERALEESERRYRAIVESQSELICRFRPDGTILFANAAYARSVEADSDSLIGKNFWNLIPPEDRPHVRALIDSLSPARPEVTIENRFLTANGERWTLWTNRALAFDIDGNVTEAQSTGIDITDRKRAEEALRDADRRKNEFLATLGHELRNPLAPIRNMLEVLERADDDADLRHRARMTMSRQLDVMVRLVDDLLDVARISRGLLQLRIETVELATVVQEAVEDVRHAIDGAGHELSVRLPDQPVLLEGDPVRLAQTLVNLLSNAVKYTPDGGRIELVAERQGEEVQIAIRDNGLGIPTDRLNAIFDMFEQVEHSLDRGHTGLGIGLGLVRTLVELHGGRVEARSAGLGKGSEFVVSLPVKPESQTEAAAPADAASGAQVSRRVLVVDDNRDAASSLALLLDMLGHESRVAFDGEEALEAAEQFKPDIVLLDIGLPKLSGHDVARRMRERPWGDATVIVAVTGWGQESDREASRAAGCDAHVTKPLTLEKLQETLQATRP